MEQITLVVVFNRLPSAQSDVPLNPVLLQPECSRIFYQLQTCLPPYLQYHTLQHTLDVCRRAEEIALAEGVPPRETQLLLVAAAYHDAGYLQQAHHHEVVSCRLAAAALPDFGYPAAAIQTVCGCIMATRLPQAPQTILQQILCDADLDYLGRADFLETGNRLYEELWQQGLVANKKEWNEKQVLFLKNHRYFTATANRQRAACKAENLNRIQQKLIET